MTEFLPLESRIDNETGLTLRAVSLEDAEHFHSVVQKNQDHFAKFDFLAPQFESLLDTENAIEHLVHHHEKARGVSYGLWEGTQLLGLVTVNLIDWQNRTADIGYWLSEQASGRGVAYKALQLLKGYLFDQLKLEKLTAYTATTNLRSRNLLEKIGFQKVKLLENRLEVRGQSLNNYLYCLDRN